MPYKVKSNEETIIINESELFRLFLTKAQANEELKQKIDSFTKIYSEVINAELVIQLSISQMMTTFFVLGYQFANFELKNDVQYEPTAPATTETN